MDDTPRRQEEAEILALLEQIIHAAEEAQRYVQEELQTGFLDRDEINMRLLHIRAVSIEIDHILNPHKKPFVP